MISLLHIICNTVYDVQTRSTSFDYSILLYCSIFRPTRDCSMHCSATDAVSEYYRYLLFLLEANVFVSIRDTRFLSKPQTFLFDHE